MWPPLPIRLKMLVAIAILPMLLFINTKQTSATTAMTYGLGGYKMDDKQQMMVPNDTKLLTTVSTDEVNKYKTNDHADKQFKACKVAVNKENGFEVFYDEDAAKEGCTVDFVMRVDEIKTRIKVADKKLDCLKDCGRNEMASSSENLVPFTYSQSNEDIKVVHNGPPYKEDQTSCKNTGCWFSDNKCMASATSLQLAWTKCAKEAVKARAWIQLVGEPISVWSAETKDNPDEAIFDLYIGIDKNPEFPLIKVPLFAVKGPTGTSSFLYKKGADGKFKYPDCFPDHHVPMIPEPKFWTINSGNAELKDSRLLVFHLLPQKATRKYDDDGNLQNDQPPATGMPKCNGKLSIIFPNAVGILQSVPPEPTENTTLVGTATPDGSEQTPSEDNATTAEGAIDTTLIIAIAAGGAVLVLVIVAVLVWCLCCRNKKDDSDEENEDKEKTAEEANQDYALFEKDAASKKGVRVPETVEQGEDE